MNSEEVASKRLNETTADVIASWPQGGAAISISLGSTFVKEGKWILNNIISKSDPDNYRDTSMAGFWKQKNYK